MAFLDSAWTEYVQGFIDDEPTGETFVDSAWTAYVQAQVDAEFGWADSAWTSYAQDTLDAEGLPSGIFRFDGAGTLVPMEILEL